MGIIGMLLGQKLASLFVLTTVAFGISTIIVAVQKNNLNDDLDDCEDQLSTACPDVTMFTCPTTTVYVPCPTTQQTTTTALTTPTTTTAPTTSTTTTTTMAPVPQIDYRLPDNVRPIIYDLWIHPNLDTLIFTGTVTIDLNVTQRTNTIILHQHFLTIGTVTFTDPNPSNVVHTGHTFDELLEQMTINLSGFIEPGDNYQLYIEFSGELIGQIVGLYGSSYRAEDGTQRYIATSKFEPTYARQAFPCFDEPQMKAKYKISLEYPTVGYNALSNMDIERTEVNPTNTALSTAYFKESVPMSTYLTVFIVSDFQFKSEPINTQGIGAPFDLRVFSTPAQLDKVDFALDTGKAIIEFYIDYFRIPYPLPKLDMAAIPDFVSGAMETWGLITYRETSILYDESTSSTTNKQRVASVIAHEMAHMWFGNLVTMKWWNDLWLNEGFASYIEYKGTNSKYPDWGMLDQFIVDDLHGVLDLDATPASHPIVQKVENPDQITEIFDTITYSKGSSLIRMVEDFIGETNFRTSITNYLNAHIYDNAVTGDLFVEMDKLNLGYDIIAIMDTWTKQMGFPVVNIEQLSPTSFRLTQKRFFSDPANDNLPPSEPSEFNYRWSIPITYVTDADPNTVQRQWFYLNDESITINTPAAVKWLKVNKNQVGYYRVNYPVDMWLELSNQLVTNLNTLTISDRASLLNDAFILADATKLPYNIAFDMTKYLANELEYVPWDTVSSKMKSIRNLLYFQSDVFPLFRKYVTDLVDKAYSDVGWTVSGAEHLKNLFRITILDLACAMGHKGCLQEAGARFTTWLSNPDVRPHPDIRSTVYYFGMQTMGNEETWEQVFDIFANESDASEKSKLMNALAAVQSPWLLKRFLDLAYDEKYVRSQDYFTCVQNIAANRIGESIVWQFVTDEWEKLVDRFGLNERYLGRMIPSITSRFYTQSQLNSMTEFFAKYPDAGAGTAARGQALATVSNNIQWLANNKVQISDWLTEYNNTQ